MKKLTLKQQLFAEHFEGNGTDACRQAGYKGSDNVLAQQARMNLRNPQIIEVIERRQEEENSAYIADREARQKFWSDTMLNPEEPIQARLKASEILGKSCGDFVVRIEEDKSSRLFSELLIEVTAVASQEPLVKELDNDEGELS